MKNLLLLVACVFLFASFSAAQKTSLDYAAEGSKHYLKGDYAKAIAPYQKAVDLEKKERKLEKSIWIVVVDNVAMAYGITGDSFNSPPVLGGVDALRGRGGSVLEYGISKEPTYPLFYYNMACGYGELADEDNAINYSTPPVLGGVAPVSGDGVVAFKYKANMIAGERFPNPETDSSFEKFRDSDKFKKSITEMKAENSLQIGFPSSQNRHRGRHDAPISKTISSYSIY